MGGFNLSRRGFLAGAIATLVTRNLAAPVRVREPRTWIWQNFTGWQYATTEPSLVSQCCAMRNDGQYFYAAAVIHYREIEQIEDIRDIQAEKQLQARHLLDDFLHPECDCSPGVYCKRHNFLAPTEVAAEELVEA